VELYNTFYRSIIKAIKSKTMR